MKRSLLISILALLVSFPLQGKLHVVASLPDFGAIAQAVGGDAIEVTTIARGSEDPHFVDARPSFVRVLNRADLLIEGGAELEVGWLPPLVTAARNRKIQGASEGHLVLAPAVRLLDLPTGPLDRSMGDVHARGNPHFWLDPRNGKIIGEQIAARLEQLDGKNAALYQKNLAAFKAKLDQKWQEWEAKLKPLQGAKAITYHKTYEYLAAAFGLEIVGQLEPRPGIEPSAVHVSRLVRQAREDGVRLVIIEPFRPRKMAEQVAEAAGAALVVLPDKTGSTPGVADYFSLFDAITTQLAAARPSPK